MKPALLPLLIASVFLCCVGCRSTSGGRSLSHRYLQTLVPGVTRYRQVVSEIGEPWELLDGQRVVAYIWETNHGTYEFMNASKEGMILSRVHAAILRFDDTGTLREQALITSRDREQLRRDMQGWAQQR